MTNGVELEEAVEEQAEKPAERPFCKVGHKCPSCLAEMERELEPGEAKNAIGRPIELFRSKKAPGELECPNCAETFPVVPEPEPEADPEPEEKKGKNGKKSK